MNLEDLLVQDCVFVVVLMAYHRRTRLSEEPGSKEKLLALLQPYPAS